MYGYISDIQCVCVTLVSPPSVVGLVLLNIRFVIVDVLVCLGLIEQDCVRAYADLAALELVSLRTLTLIQPLICARGNHVFPAYHTSQNTARSRYGGYA